MSISDKEILNLIGEEHKTKILEKRKILYRKVSVLILMFIFSMSLVCVSNSNIVLAVKEAMIQIVSF